MTNQNKKKYVLSRKNLSRACVFIDSSDPSMPYQVIESEVQPLIKLPFPPVIDPVDLIVQNGDNVPARAPNAFIIYRKVFIDAAHVDGYRLPMRIMSSMASQSWEQESDIVKSEYRRLASEALNLRNEMYPKTGCKRKRAKWNIVSFKNKNKITKKRQKWNIVSFDSKDEQNESTVENQSEEIQQTASQNLIINKDDDFLTNFNDIFPSPEMNFDNVNNVNETPNFAYQDLIPSPDLSIASSASSASSFSPELNQIEYDIDFCYSGQTFDGIFNQNDNLNTQNTNLFVYNQSPEFATFACNNNNNNNNDNNDNNISSPEYFVNFQSDNIESDVSHLYYNMNYFSGLGISDTLLEPIPSIEYF